MAYKVPIKEHQAFIKARWQDNEAIRSYNHFLVMTAINAERKHCISVGNHFGKVNGSTCYYCGGER